MPFTSQFPVHRRTNRFTRSCPIVTHPQPDGTLHDVYREDIPLPPVENFKLSNLLKAGVPLEEVNTKILGSESIDLTRLSSSDSSSGIVTDPSSGTVTDSVDSSDES